MNSVIETLERMTLLVPQNLTRASNRLPDCFLRLMYLRRSCSGGSTSRVQQLVAGQDPLSCGSVHATIP